MSEDFSVPWLTIETLRPSAKSTSVTVNKSKQDHLKQRTTEVALFIHDEYPYPSFDQLEKLFAKLKNFLLEQTTLSVYELASSDLIDALLKVFDDVPRDTRSLILDKDFVIQRAALFGSIFLSDE